MASRTVGDFPIKGKIVAITGGGSGIYLFSSIAFHLPLSYGHEKRAANTVSIPPVLLPWDASVHLR